MKENNYHVDYFEWMWHIFLLEFLVLVQNNIRQWVIHPLTHGVRFFQGEEWQFLKGSMGCFLVNVTIPSLLSNSMYVPMFIKWLLITHRGRIYYNKRNEKWWWWPNSVFEIDDFFCVTKNIRTFVSKNCHEISWDT